MEDHAGEDHGGQRPRDAVRREMAPSQSCHSVGRNSLSPSMNPTDPPPPGCRLAASLEQAEPGWARVGAVEEGAAPHTHLSRPRMKALKRMV